MCLLVGIADRAQHLADVVDRVVHRDGALLQLVGHGGAFDVLHHHVQLVVGGECGPKRGNIGMVQAGHELDLALETGGQILPSRQVREQDFHGFDAVGDDVPHPPDPAHSSAAQLVKNLVIADTLAGLLRSSETLPVPVDAELGMAALLAGGS